MHRTKLLKNTILANNILISFKLCQIKHKADKSFKEILETILGILTTSFKIIKHC